MPLFRKVPKRGFTNARFKKHYTLVNVQSLNSFPEGTEVELASVLEKGLARRTGGMLKVLGQGEISVKLTVRAHHFSESARKKIEEAGGTVEVLS